MRNLFWFFILAGIALYFVYNGFFERKGNGLDRLKANYGADIDAVCAEMGLPAAYFKALVILESSAEKPAHTRFEAHIYQKLKDVKEGHLERYGKFTTSQLKHVSENTLEKLSTSWGPMQIMGYHCIPLGIDFEQLQGSESIRYGIQWADKSYGNLLRQGDFKNAFHIHNTGQRIPDSGKILTHDPKYIDRGMEYMAAFK